MKFLPLACVPLICFLAKASAEEAPEARVERRLSGVVLDEPHRRARGLEDAPDRLHHLGADSVTRDRDDLMGVRHAVEGNACRGGPTSGGAVRLLQADR